MKEFSIDIFNHKISKCIIACAIFILISVSISLKINLNIADLGRHLKNGEYFFINWQPIKTNFYSYTMNDKFTINHHWLSGVIFYLVYRLSGFYGLSLFYFSLYLLVLLLLFSLAQKKSNFYPALITLIIGIPLFAHRREIRPEIFSYLGIVLYLLIFENLTKIKNLKLALFCLLLYQTFWSNSHILAVLGPFIAGIYLLERIIKKIYQDIIILITFLFSSILSLVITPFGYQGLLGSLSIMHEYGYRLAENMNLWFMINWSQGGLWIYQYSLFLIVLIIFLVLWQVYKLKNIRTLDILVIIFGFIAFLMNRNLPMFGIISTLWLAELLNKYINRVKIYIITMILSLLILILANGNLRLINPNTGFGLSIGNEKSAQFFKSQRIQGPIFNNYDIGGFLIFELFPEEKVFVDNRPEAYSKSFFENIYNPALTNEVNWLALDKQYSFNVIYFYRRDMTDNAQSFLYRRTQDPQWVPIYVDDFILILIKNEVKNKKLIEKYGLAKEIFTQSKN